MSCLKVLIERRRVHQVKNIVHCTKFRLDQERKMPINLTLVIT